MSRILFVRGNGSFLGPRSPGWVYQMDLGPGLAAGAPWGRLTSRNIALSLLSTLSRLRNGYRNALIASDGNIETQKSPGPVRSLRDSYSTESTPRLTSEKINQ
ncbi:hypothetical protein PGQ11_007177 [Apiospora arundinis]|uniref:Uncharacterized protein n=1 Tax=Apiospora arundinis TaxID=335852 RepID=A0ABR2IVF1_9PEZI